MSENYFTEWRSLQREYRTILLSKAEDEGEVKAARGFRVEIRQIVVPDLGSVDRCVSCHLGLSDPRMTDVPQPFAAHPGPFLKDHDVDKFGCTSCHRGQGRATIGHEAHGREGEVPWEWPVLPPPYTQSTCGVCHDSEYLASRGAPVLGAGFELFRTIGCLSCHELGGRGGALGPALDRVGEKGRHALSFAHVSGEREIWQWHMEHLRAPADVVPDSKMPSTGEDEEQRQALTTFLLSLQKSNLTESMTPWDRYEQRYRLWHTPPLTGEQLYRQFCFACHDEGTETVLHDTLDVAIPSIRNPDFLSVATQEFLVRSIDEGREGTDMQAWGPEGGGLSSEEIIRLADYLLSSREVVREVDFVMSEGADSRRGEEIFLAECTECHETTREESFATWLGGAGFQATYSDALIGHNIEYGREDTLMNPYGEEQGGDFNAEQISDLVAFIRTLGEASPTQPLVD